MSYLLKSKTLKPLVFIFVGLLFGLSTMASCHKKTESKTNILPDSTIYSKQNFTNRVIDSSSIVAFFKINPASDSVKKDVYQFYMRRAYQFAWFNQNGMTCAIANFYNQIQNYTRDFADNSFQNTRLVTLFAAAERDEKEFLMQDKYVQEFELLLTSTYFKYAKVAYGGIAKNTFDLEWFIPRKKKNYQILLDSLVSSVECKNLQEPVNQYYIKLKEKLGQYRKLQDKGGFPTIKTTKKLLVLGDKDSCLLQTKRYLLLTGDLKINDNSDLFTDSLALAVKRFQQRMGLATTGKIDHATITEFNKPIDFRIKQMMVNMERLRWIPLELENDYLLVNIPEFRLHIFENGKLAWATNVVVGKNVHQTSIFRGNLSQIVLNPYWGVPMSIARNEILPKLKRNPAYLKNNNIEVFSGNTPINPYSINWQNYGKNLPYTFRQKPGNNNALGKIKFLFPNNYHIYLHDTPSKSLFAESKRAFSLGCIRVENPKKLALYLLRTNTNWSAEKVDNILATNTETTIRISPTVPVYIAYFTAWVDSNGQLNFRNDLYNLDNKLAKEIFGE